MINTLKAKIQSNPFLSVLASAVVTYALAKYGPAISQVCSTIGK